ncbi:efflux RND transporter periplasmic adaptor subunit [Arenibacter sp. GZD96]|uniref:efflux RND transporter periplasmic adaptor subunit n=1 Tax=Aurantibrevibacter litoralis TaxID=3106030 RepID=UPI002AFFFA21|nr:efflux RND transporter periplasmic adaptor subunit [Arenibacter sp. GZD-96]MEA1785743.1 efflux RND transporter periplasmic adaptor subunit [Arenibacter sp. GZD-96]
MQNKIINRFKIPVFFAGIVLLGSFVSCGTTEKPSSEVSDTQDVVTLSDAQFASGQMAVGKMTLREFTNVIKVNGVFDVPPENRTTVSAYFAGYVKKLTLLPGESVKKGQVLFTLENPEYIQVQQNFLEARGRLAYLKSDYERQKALLADEVTSQKNFLKAESDYTVTQAQYQSLRKQLVLMNINPDAITAERLSAVISVVAPLSGFVTSVPITQGMYLNPSDEAVTITNLDNMHFELKVYEKDLPFIEEGQTIRAKLQNNEEKEILGEVHLVNRTIHATDRSVAIHGDILHPEDAELLTPGMYVEAEIITSTATYLALPEEAIVSIENEPIVLVKEADNTFRRRALQIGITKDGYTQILNASDFDPETVFLTAGVFNLISE